MRSPLISIIMPVYNRANLIADSINSILAQTDPDWELLLADDGSTDTTLEWLSDHIRDPRIRILSFPHRGVAVTRNTALRMAKGNYFCFLDSDDTWPSNKLAIQREHMLRTGATISIGWFIDRSGPLDPNPLLRTCPDAITYHDLLVENCVLFQTLMAHVSVISAFEFPSVHHEDYALALRLLRSGYVLSVIPHVLAYRLRHKRSLTANKVRSALWRWTIYRHEAQLSRIQAVVYSLRYVFRQLGKRKRP